MINNNKKMGINSKLSKDLFYVCLKFMNKLTTRIMITKS